MIKAAMNRFIELIQATNPVTEIEGRPYQTVTMTPILDPSPEILILSTLTGLADYLNSGLEWGELEEAIPVEIGEDGAVLTNQTVSLTDLFIMVDDPVAVTLYETVSGVFEQRNTIAHVGAALPASNLSAWKDLETFIIQAQVLYEMTSELAALLKVVGNLKEETGINHADDGISQHVTAKTGIATVEDAVLPNPVILKPYRTFLEVDQPESPFILRMRKRADGPEICLFNADGGKWQLEAVQRVKAWLAAHIPKTVKVFA